MSNKTTNTNLLKLKQELKQANNNTERWRSDYIGKCNELNIAEAKIEVYQRSSDFTKGILSENYRQEIERLIEIVRWHINPETTKIKKEEKGDIYPRSRY